MDRGSLCDKDGKVFTSIMAKPLMLIDQGGTCLHIEIPDDSL
jgi:hypothetical protein